MSDFQELLKNAGIHVPEQSAKRDTSKINSKDKVDKAQYFLERSEKKLAELNSATNKDEVIDCQDSLVLNFQRFCEAIKDILIFICKNQNISLSANRSLSEVLRKSSSLFHLSPAMHEAVSTLRQRNDIVHDYLNTEFYDEEVIRLLTNYYKEYFQFVQTIMKFCSEHNLISN